MDFSLRCSTLFIFVGFKNKRKSNKFAERNGKFGDLPTEVLHGGEKTPNPAP